MYQITMPYPDHGLVFSCHDTLEEAGDALIHDHKKYHELQIRRGEPRIIPDETEQEKAEMTLQLIMRANQNK